jgi:hypothetical protein
MHAFSSGRVTLPRVMRIRSAPGRWGGSTSLGAVGPGPASLGAGQVGLARSVPDCQRAHPYHRNRGLVRSPNPGAGPLRGMAPSRASTIGPVWPGARLRLDPRHARARRDLSTGALFALCLGLPASCRPEWLDPQGIGPRRPGIRGRLCPANFRCPARVVRLRLSAFLPEAGRPGAEGAGERRNMARVDRRAALA